MRRVTVLSDLPGGGLVADHLRRCGWLLATYGDFGDAVVVLTEAPPTPDVERALMAYGGALVLAGPTLAAWRDSPLAERTGVLPTTSTVRAEVRVGDLLVTDALLLVEKVTDDTEVLAAASWQLGTHPVATVRGAVGTVTLGGFDDPAVLRLLHRTLRRAAGLPEPADVRVGLLGYGAIGHEHAAAIAATPGLTLTAVCDRNPDRTAAALALAPDVRTGADPDALLADPGVDLVVVSTPPNSHVSWALGALSAGKHVVVEKPFCLTVAEADAMIRLAAVHDRALAVYQNRRWDPDYLALKRVVRSGALGDVFHLESFIGGYGHPCAYWHSDEEVSGGAIYDWGSHYLDWTLDLLPQRVEWVAATTQKRVWHDVTNADHSRVTIRFADGAEAEFVHSDIAAATKPKWYVLGTAGAVRGDWQDVAVPSDVPALLTVFNAHGDRQRLTVPPAPPQPFHRELADRLRYGEPMSITPDGSRRNIAVMEAATYSARDGGRPVPVAE